jgi:hypothetical protein
MTRPDLSYALSLCGRHNANPTQAHMDATNRVYAYLRNTPNIGITYKHSPSAKLTGSKHGASADNLSLMGYVDSDWVGCLDIRRSTTG